MNDKEMLDWMQANYVSFAEDGFGDRPYTLTFIGNGGQNLIQRGPSLRACVLAAAERLETHAQNSQKGTP